MVAPDDVAFESLAGREYAPRGPEWDSTLARWRQVPSDEGATHDGSVSLDASLLEPMITYGTNPAMGIPITGRIPTPEALADPTHRPALEKSLRYMDLRSGQGFLGP